MRTTRQPCYAGQSQFTRSVARDSRVPGACPPVDFCRPQPLESVTKPAETVSWHAAPQKNLMWRYARAGFVQVGRITTVQNTSYMD